MTAPSGRTMTGLQSISDISEISDISGRSSTIAAPVALPKGRIGRSRDLLTMVTARPERCVLSPSEATCGRLAPSDGHSGRRVG